MDIGVLITGGVGILTTILGSWASWFFTRKKFNSEVDSNEIENLKKSLEFYEKIIRDNNSKLQFYIDLSERNLVETYRLKSVIHRILNNSCLDNGCTKRAFYTEDQIRDILGEIKYTEEQDETKD